MPVLVTFESSETGEVLMFGEIAGILLDLLGKEKTAQGAFLVDEMAPAAVRLRQAVSEADACLEAEGDDERAEERRKAAEDEAKSPVVPMPLARRAWPLIDMLERTARAGEKANIIWRASGPF